MQVSVYTASIVADKGNHNDMLHDELAGLINMLKECKSKLATRWIYKHFMINMLSFICKPKCIHKH